MNIWGWIFVAPVIAMLLVDPGRTIIVVAILLAVYGGAVVIFDWVLGDSRHRKQMKEGKDSPPRKDPEK